MIEPELRSDIAIGVTDVQNELLLVERIQADQQTSSAGESLQLILRRAHSLKGLLRLAEMPSAASLIHQIESVLVVHLHSETPIQRACFDIGFDALDAIAASLELPQEDAPRLFALTAHLKSLCGTSAPAQSGQRRFPFIPTVREFRAIKAARDSRQRLYVVEKAIRTNLFIQQFETLPIREDLHSTGTIVGVRPAYSDLDWSRQEAIVTFVVATQLSGPELESVIFDSWAFCEWPDPPPTEDLRLPRRAPPRVEIDSAPRLRFLVVEDEPTSQFLLRELLRSYGESDAVSNGVEAVAAISSSIESRRPFHAVCLDIMMPGLDGLAVLRELRRLESEALLPEHQKVKVIMTTALSDYEHFHQAFVEECDSYLVKPIGVQAINRQLVRLGLVQRTKC